MLTLMATSANLSLSLGEKMTWREVVEFVELGNGLGMQPDDTVFVERNDEGEADGLTIIVDAARIAPRADHN